MMTHILRATIVLLVSALAFSACRRGRDAAAAGGCGDRDECEELLEECMEEHDADDHDDIRESLQSCIAVGNASLERNDMSIAVPALARACKMGERKGCDGLAKAGLKLHHGAGVRKDDKAAFGLFHVGCDGRSGSACFNLGYMYEHGVGVTKHADYAAFAYRRACDNQYVDGCYNLAIMKLGDQGITKDRPAAVALFRQTCTEGHVAACVRLGGHLERGDGVTKDEFEAATLYDALCGSGEKVGCKKLAVLTARNPAAGRFIDDQKRRQAERLAAKDRAERRQEMADLKRMTAEAARRAEDDRRRANQAEAALQEREQELQDERSRQAELERRARVRQRLNTLRPPSGPVHRKQTKHRSVNLCYDHECNGVRSGRHCFKSKQAYCNSLCAERDCVSQMVCKRECK